MFGLKGKAKTKERKLIIDLGTQYVKIIDISVKKNQAKLHNFKILNLVSSGRRFASKEISKIIKKSLLDMKINETTAHISISGKPVVVRFMDLPKIAAKDLKGSLKNQPDLRLPFKLEEAYYDCQILPGVEVPQGKMKVVVAIAPKKEVAKTTEIITGAGLICSKIDVDVIALANAFEWGKTKEEDESYALVNIGAARTNLSIIHKGFPSLCRELDYGGIPFSETIASQLNIGFDDAEAKKIRGDAEVLGILEEALKPLSTGILQSFEFFEGSSGSRISKVYISGGGAQIRGITDFLKTSLNRNVLIWNTLRSIDFESIQDKELLQSNSPLLTIALGIGLGEGEI
ncbi:MAG: hypothetical protein ACD_79C00274G0004 [uncultured bacterium]|nr:MAG: hypothetical protein ACD_79C00274G0004 [uncultured bacterium]